jgi:hypothetical protein
MLKHEPIKGQGIISIRAMERYHPGRAVTARFFMIAAGYGRERQLLARLPSGEQVPGQLLKSYTSCNLLPHACHLGRCSLKSA